MDSHNKSEKDYREITKKLLARRQKAVYEELAMVTYPTTEQIERTRKINEEVNRASWMLKFLRENCSIAMKNSARKAGNSEKDFVKCAREAQAKAEERARNLREPLAEAAASVMQFFITTKEALNATTPEIRNLSRHVNQRYRETMGFLPFVTFNDQKYKEYFQLFVAQTNIVPLVYAGMDNSTIDRVIPLLWGGDKQG